MGPPRGSVGAAIGLSLGILLAGPAVAAAGATGAVVPLQDLPGSPGQYHQINPEVTLQPEGGVLLFSDDPEAIVAGMVLPGAGYRDAATGAFRIFFHHANRTGVALVQAVALTNPGPEPVALYARGAGIGVSLYPDQAGQTAMAAFLASREEVTFLGVLPAGQSLEVSPTEVPASDTVSGVEEFVALTAPRGTEAAAALARALEATPFADVAGHGLPSGLPAGFAPATVVVTDLLYRAGSPAPADPDAVPVLPSTALLRLVAPGLYALHRGTFPAYDRYGVVTVDEAAYAEQDLAVDTGVLGPQAMAGEYLVGRDATDGLAGYEPGNYGVVYDLHVVVEETPPTPPPVALLLWPSGGFGHYSLSLDGAVLRSLFVRYSQAWYCAQVAVPGARGFAALDASLVGGSYGPQRLLFVQGFSVAGVSVPVVGVPPGSAAAGGAG
jgi:hypothetical protein